MGGAAEVAGAGSVVVATEIPEPTSWRSNSGMTAGDRRRWCAEVKLGQTIAVMLGSLASASCLPALISRIEAATAAAKNPAAQRNATVYP